LNLQDSFGATQLSVQDNQGTELSLTPGVTNAATDAVDGVLAVGRATVAGLTTTVAAGTYGVGAVVTLKLTFDQAISVDTSGGTPRLPLNSGGTASYTGQFSPNTLVFRYVVGSGDSALVLDAVSATALHLNGATIRSLVSDTDANLTLPVPGTAGSLSA